MTPTPCWSCGTTGPCRPTCACAKCADPERYDDWRYNHPREYGDWLRRNGFDTTCDLCGGDKYPVDHLRPDVASDPVASTWPHDCCCSW